MNQSKLGPQGAHHLAWEADRRVKRSKRNVPGTAVTAPTGSREESAQNTDGGRCGSAEEATSELMTRGQRAGATSRDISAPGMSSQSGCSPRGLGVPGRRAGRKEPSRAFRSPASRLRLPVSYGVRTLRLDAASGF